MQSFWKKIFYQNVPPAIDHDYHIILSNYSTYYRNLNDHLKQHFRYRVYRLLKMMAFSSDHFRVVTREMRVVIVSAIVIITFGLKKYTPLRFRHIEVMPRRYMYPGYGQPFLGHTDFTNDMIFFSWKDVQDGFFIPDDAINVALHEMSHVIEVENRYFNLFNRFFKQVEWSKWAKHATHQFIKIHQGNNYFLNPYAGTNMKEMFAVCIETFYEQPAEFYKHLPQLYATMVRLLNQNPLNQKNPTHFEY